MLLKRLLCATVLFLLPSAFAKTVPDSQLINCEAGAYLFGEKCYERFANKVENGLTWEQAAKFCEDHINGNLVTIDSKELQDFLTAFILLQIKLNLWIGLNDREAESVYKWSDGSTTNYTNWGPNEPSGESENCVELRYKHHGVNAVWNDVPCSYLAPFICQYSKNAMVSSQDSRFCSAEKGGGFRFFNSCYHIVPEEKSWDDAEAYCQKDLKGHLLTILNPTVEMFLNYILSDFDKEFWIGLKLGESKQLIWSSGWHTVYNNFSDEHKVFLDDTCAVKSKQNQWISAPCSEMRPFVCEVSSEKPVDLENAPEGGRCPNTSQDWRDLGGDKCYTFEDDPVNWDDANSVCVQKGGTLAVIESKAESEALHHYVEPHDGMYIGLHRNSTNEEVFEWVDGTARYYQNWRRGEPNSKDEKCGVIWTDNMEWNDDSCTSVHPFLCSVRKIIVNCTETTHGCCPDGKTAAGGPDQEECPTVVKSCEDTVYGCCPDGKTAAKGSNQVGCPMIMKQDCEDTVYGCCPDGKTVAEDPDQKGCPMTSRKNCTGNEIAECKRSFKQSCTDAIYGCCADGKTAAEGPNQAGCPRNLGYVKVIIGISVCLILMFIFLGVAVYYIRHRNAKSRKYSTELVVTNQE